MRCRRRSRGGLAFLAAYADLFAAPMAAWASATPKAGTGATCWVTINPLLSPSFQAPG